MDMLDLLADIPLESSKLEDKIKVLFRGQVFERSTITIEYNKDILYYFGRGDKEAISHLCNFRIRW